MEKKTFAVVEFADDNSIEIVPTTWLEEAAEGTFCYWTFTNTRKLVKKNAMPDKQKWRRHPIKKIWLQTDSFEKALQKSQRATETSNIETEDTSIKKRPHKKPSRFHSENDITSDDDSRDTPIKKNKISKPVPPKYQPLPKTFPQDMERQQKTRSPDLFYESLPECSLTNMSPLHQVSDLLLNEPQNPTEEATKNYRTKVLQKLQELVENQQDILAMQRTVLAALAPSNMADEDILDGPCQTLEDFAQLDKMLENGDKRTKMLNYLRSLGGADEGAAVRKMMRKVASTEVLSAYSLKGRKGKLAFQSLRICNIIISVCSFISLPESSLVHIG
ncbi:uncharacterized protein LOC130432294 isoform X3 [Triplophysa dalaica]|uniref:uncharacterized protein LOC130432294 isoform X3 n=1 Tax=Triplophysa dalaica TaxID=1582913 RepID=UPI0024E008AE|nr:uncharacterized protein LOC130432294 isoform X3 [Triplophysa dalaica]